MRINKNIKGYKTLHNGKLSQVVKSPKGGFSAVSCVHLSKFFMGIKAVNDLSVEFPRGLITGLIGPNGSGKSTLVNLLTGLLQPNDGLILLNGRAYPYVKPHKLRKFKVSRTFQDSRLIEQMSVKDNLLLAEARNKIIGGLFEQNIKDYQTRLDMVSEATDLKEHLYKKAEDLSYGLRKLVEIGRVLMQDSDICFFDEPFTGLFPEMVERVSDLILKLREQGKTIILIEHNMGLIERLADYIVVLDHGSLLAQGAPKDILKNKQVQQAYLGV